MATPVNYDTHYILHKGNQLLIFQETGEYPWVDQILAVTTSKDNKGTSHTQHDNMKIVSGPDEAREIWENKVKDGWSRVK